MVLMNSLIMPLLQFHRVFDVMRIWIETCYNMLEDDVKKSLKNFIENTMKHDTSLDSREVVSMRLLQCLERVVSITLSALTASSCFLYAAYCVTYHLTFSSSVLGTFTTTKIDRSESERCNRRQGKKKTVMFMYKQPLNKIN